MNEYHMTYLAKDRRRELLAEAQRARLARPVAHQPVVRRPTGPRSALRLGLDLLLRRDPARA